MNILLTFIIAFILGMVSSGFKIEKTGKFHKHHCGDR